MRADRDTPVTTGNEENYTGIECESQVRRKKAVMRRHFEPLKYGPQISYLHISVLTGASFRLKTFK